MATITELSNRTKGEMLANYTNTTKHQKIRNHAKRILLSIGKQAKRDRISYVGISNVTLESAHLVAIGNFSNDTLLGVINHPMMLSWLNANSHRRLDFPLIADKHYYEFVGSLLLSTQKIVDKAGYSTEHSPIIPMDRLIEWVGRAIMGDWRSQAELCRFGLGVVRPRQRTSRTTLKTDRQKTIKDVLNLNNTNGSQWVGVRSHAQMEHRFHKNPNKCMWCGWDLSINDVAHLIAPNRFGLDTPLMIVNHPANTVRLCKEHNWLWDQQFNPVYQDDILKMSIFLADQIKDRKQISIDGIVSEFNPIDYMKSYVVEPTLSPFFSYA